MKHTIISLALMAVPGWLPAQDTPKPFRYNGNGFVFFSAGACIHRYLNLGGGGGGEGFLWRGLTLGGEVGYYRFPADRNPGYGLFSIGPGYHFVNRDTAAKWDPYLNVGLLGGAFMPGFFTGAGSLGGGVNYWFKQRMGLQTGVQVQVLNRSDAVIAFRIGLSFR
jgi:hypothetical protein